MALTPADLADFAGADPTADASELASCVAVATDLVDEYTAEVDPADPIPPATLQRAYLVVAAELFNQGNAPGGILNADYGDESGTSIPVRVAADPLRPARPLLGFWVDPVTIA